MQARAGQALTLGLRPEHIGGTVGAPVAAVLERVEAAGPENFFYCSSHGLPFVMRTPAASAAKTGDSLALCFDMAQAHFFDPATGQTLA
jgi:ABC-type sugar transport system ATPase subunit